MTQEELVQAHTNGTHSYYKLKAALDRLKIRLDYGAITNDEYVRDKDIFEKKYLTNPYPPGSEAAAKFTAGYEETKAKH